MRNLFNPDAPIIQAMSKFSYLIWMNCLWLVCCLPIVTIGASTAAFYRMAFNLREEKKCTAGEFFRAFKENFKHSTVMWLIQLAAALVIGLIYYRGLVVENEAVGMAAVLIACVLFVVWGFWFLYSFPLTCYFENTLGRTMLNAMAMSIKHLRQTVLCFALAMIPVIALIFSEYWFLRLLYVWLLFYPGLAAYWNTGILTPVFEEYTK